MKMRSEQRYQQQMRSTLLVLLAAAISLWGLLAIHRTLALTGNWEHFLLRQTIWAGVAWTLFFAVSKIKFDSLMRGAYPGAIVGALSLVLLPLLGSRINGMCGWYTFCGLTIQPSEIFKVFYLLAIIKLLYDKKIPEAMRVFSCVGIIAVFALLLFIQPDFGTMTVYLAGGLGTLYFSKVKFKYIAVMLGLAALTALLAIALNGYMAARIRHFINPELDPGGGAWHLRQFAIAAARGEWFGVKADMAVWSNSFLPLAHNDSIFAALCEILGFCGGMILLLLYAGFFHQAFSLSAWQRNNMRRSVIDSLTAMILFQTLLHIAVNLNLLPPTGITLPLVSYGGSSLTGTMLMIAVIISAGNRKSSPLPALES